MIAELTVSQKSRFPEYVKKWTDVGLCTLPASRKEAEAGIEEAYAAAGLKKPKIVWCGSPLSQGMTRAIIFDKKIMASVWDSVRDSVGDSVWASVRASVWDSVWDSVGASVWDSGHGQHDANWIGFYDFFARELGLFEQTKKVAGLTKITENAGWFLPHQKLCWVSERHNVLNRILRAGCTKTAARPWLIPTGLRFTP